MTTAVYLIASPLQMLYALEARVSFPAEQHVLCTLETGFDSDRRQIDELAGHEQWTERYRLPWPARPNRLIRTVRQIRLARAIRRRFGVVDRLFAGDYNFALNTLVEHRRFYLLSDGNKVIWQRSQFGRSYELALTRIPFLNRVLTRLVPLLARRSQDVHYFSPFLFDGADEWMVTHDFAWLRRHLGVVDQREQDPTIVYFLGAYLSEGVWTRYTTEPYFLESMRRIAAHYAMQGKRLVYIPHRHEDPAKLARLCVRVPDLEIVRFERGVELEFLRRGVTPTHVASFVSTGLYNLTRIYPACRIEAFQLDPEAFLPKAFWPRFVAIYAYYESHMHVDRELLIGHG